MHWPLLAKLCCPHRCECEDFDVIKRAMCRKAKRACDEGGRRRYIAHRRQLREELVQDQKLCCEARPRGGVEDELAFRRVTSVSLSGVRAY